jgi:hypothetical protein
MNKRAPLRATLLKVLSENKPLSAKEIVKASGINEKHVWDALYYYWMMGLLLRAEKPVFENQANFKGRGGLTRNTRSYYLYMLKPEGKDSIFILGQRFVPFKKKYLDIRGSRDTSKARMVFEFLRDNSEKAFFSTDIAKNLEKKGVLVRDVMGTVRRYESSIYVRGYRTDQRQTPFKEGFLLTWLDQNKPREQAIEEAIQRTDNVLAGRNSTNPLIERVHLIRDMIIEATKLKDQRARAARLLSAESIYRRALPAQWRFGASASQISLNCESNCADFTVVSFFKFRNRRSSRD